MSEQRPPPSRPRQGPVSGLLALFGRITGLVVGALLLRLLLELVGGYFWWPHQGAEHTCQVMRQEQIAFVQDLQSHPLGDKGLALLQYGQTGLLKLRERGDALLRHAISGTIVATVSSTITYAMMSFMVRLLRLMATLPLFLLCAVAGVAEGLMQRDLRTFGAGNESVFIHRYARRFSASITTNLWLIYLAQPMQPSSMYIIYATALWTGVILSVTVRSFKRWL
jgi:hypothetical protein